MSAFRTDSPVERRAALLHRLTHPGLYLVTDDRLPLAELLEKTRAALRAGATVVQYRDKAAARRELLARGAAVREVCHEAGALFIVNDHLDLALALEADGLHVGQDDLPADVARRLLPPHALLGLSVHSLEQAAAPEARAADYLGVGAMYPTETKPDARHRGLDLLRAIRAAVRVPLVAIGGITAERVAEVIASGADAVALVSAVYGAQDAGAAARRLLGAIERAREA